MRNPISDVLHFVTSPAVRWGPVPVLLFWLLTIGAIWIAGRNWKTQSDQRNGRAIYFGFARYLLGVMWLQQSFWKLPPTFTDNPDGSGGLRQWTESLAQGAAFGFHRALVRDLVLPNFYFFAYQVWAAETAVAAMLMLGVFTRLGGLLGLLMSLNLWLGLYNVPNEWSWSYFFMVLLMGFLIAVRAGRALGGDALIGPTLAARLAQQNPRLARLVEWAT